MKLYLPLAALMVMGALAQATEYKLENESIARSIESSPYLHTRQIDNKILGTKMQFEPGNEFVLRISAGTSEEGTDRILSSKDFQVIDVSSQESKEGHSILAKLYNEQEQIEITLIYTLPQSKNYIHKTLHIAAKKPITLERIEVENLQHADFYQPYTQNAITAKAYGNWKPNLGQPLYTKKSGLFFGVEFPAADNTVTDNTAQLGYLWGRELGGSEAKQYKSYQSMIGASNNAEDLSFSFQEYIDDIRNQKLRLQVQYNSWFDYGNKVTEESFIESMEKVHQELVVKRGVTPLKAYVIDDGWQDNTAPDVDKEDGVWSINQKFSPNFKKAHAAAKACQSSIGVWVSPASIFGSTAQVAPLRKAGLEAFEGAMSLAGEGYMSKLEKRMCNLTAQGISYFKFDGIFGHLITRHFELNGRGVPQMTQLDTKGFTANDPRLNDAKYDELKGYYLVAATERLMQMLKAQKATNPEVFLCISNAAYLSPWWLSYADIVWMINADDAAGGSARNQELVYRDAIYYNIFTKEQTQFPMNSLFNHEPKKTKTGESKEEFEDYLFMNISRGTCFIELYLKTFQLSDADWDVLAHGLQWADDIFPCFKSPRMIGGEPKKATYGYTGWLPERGYIALHNPTDIEETFTLSLDKKIGMTQGKKSYKLSSPLGERHTHGLKTDWKYGDSFKITLRPKEIRILCFD